MSRPPKVPTLVELKNELASSLRRTSIRPSIFGYKAQDYQIEFHASDARGRLVIGGNRSGKTVAGAAEAVMRLCGMHEHYNKHRTPIRGRAVGVDFDKGVNQIMMPEIARWMPPSMLINGSWEASYSRGDRVLTLENGSTLEFMSYDQDVDKFAGTSRHFVWFDEEPPEDIFNECLARLIDTGGDWWLTMTPLIDMSWTLDRIYTPGITEKDPNIEVFEVSTSQNVHVNSAEIEILTMGMTDEQKEARLHGKYMTYTGTIYGSVIADTTFVEPYVESDRWPLLEKWGHFGMLDHGYRNPTAFLLGAFDADGRIIIYDEYYETNRLVKENALAILSRIRELGLVNKLEYIVADPSIRNKDPIGGGSIYQEYSEHGLYMTLANNDVSAGINRVSSRLKNKQLYIAKNCVNLRWEINRYRWDKYSNSKIAGKKSNKETPMKKDDHACDALRYGVVSRPQLMGEVDMRPGNVINAPVSVNSDDFKDMELLSHMGVSYSNDHPTHSVLGSDF